MLDGENGLERVRIDVHSTGFQSVPSVRMQQRRMYANGFGAVVFIEDPWATRFQQVRFILVALECRVERHECSPRGMDIAIGCRHIHGAAVCIVH